MAWSSRPRPRLTPGIGAAAAASAAVAVRRAERALLARWPAKAAPPPSSLPPPTERWVEVDDGARLRVLDWGDGRPVVLAHGITANALDWLPVVPSLVAAGHRVLAYEHRGHGSSSLGADPCDTRRLVRDAAEVLHTVEVDDAVLVGHSLGGYVALALAATEPDAVRSRVATMVVLGATSSSRGLRELATLAAVAAPWTPALQRSRVQGPVVTGLVVFGRAPDRRAVDDVRLRWSRCDPATRRCFARHLAGEDVTSLLGRVEVPVVVARGSRDHVVSARRNAQILRALPRARPHTFAGAGHALLPEQPEAVAALIIEAARGAGAGPWR